MDLGFIKILTLLALAIIILSFLSTKLILKRQATNAYDLISDKIRLCYGSNAIEMLKIICSILEKSLEKEDERLIVVNKRLTVISSIKLFNKDAWEDIIRKTEELYELSLGITGTNNQAHLMILDIFNRIRDCEKLFNSAEEAARKASEKHGTLIHYLLEDFSQNSRPPCLTEKLKKQVDKNMGEIFPPAPDTANEEALLGLS